MQSIEQWHKASMLPLITVLSQRHGSLHGARPLVFLARWRLWRRLPPERTNVLFPGLLLHFLQLLVVARQQEVEDGVMAPVLQCRQVVGARRRFLTAIRPLTWNGVVQSQLTVLMIHVGLYICF